MANDTGLIVVLVLVAIAILMQAGAMVGIWLAVKNIHHEVQGVRADVKERLDPLTTSLGEIVSTSREPVRTITKNLAEISQMLHDRTSHVDEALADLVDRSRLQMVRVDELVGGLVRKVETTTETLQETVLVPIHEVAAVLKGVRSGLDFLFSRRRTPTVSEATQDEQLFI